MKNINEKKMFYFLIGCISLSVVIIGATYAYFTASSTSENVVSGTTESATFSLSIDRVTTIDMAYGLVPMKNEQAPHAAEQLCYDDFGNAGCQIYKITLLTDSSIIKFVDAYVFTYPKDGLETRFTRVYPKDLTDSVSEDSQSGEHKYVFQTEYNKDDFSNPDFNVSNYIKTGERGSLDNNSVNREEDYNGLFMENEMVSSNAEENVFYLMLWVYDDGTAQDYLQGMELAYSGEVIFVTAEGNEIKATFD